MYKQNPSSGSEEDFSLYQRKRAIIFANGLLNHPKAADKVIQEGDIIVAADGGAAHCQRLGITPHVLIGDMDSLSAAELSTLEDEGVQIIRHPAHKDYTDLELALAHVRDADIREVLVFGGLGERWDQTLANLLLPLAIEFKDMHIRHLDGPQEVIVLRPGKHHQVNGQAGDTLSLVPLAGDASGVSTSGLQFPLNGETLYFGSSRGISNVFERTAATIELEDGLLICIVIHTE
ncbi:MAG: thiamine diphosphokinase [Anaerolineales bacterium]